jgi:hypothetical protein
VTPAARRRTVSCHISEHAAGEVVESLGATCTIPGATTISSDVTGQAVLGCADSRRNWGPGQASARATLIGRFKGRIVRDGRPPVGLRPAGLPGPLRITEVWLLIRFQVTKVPLERLTVGSAQANSPKAISEPRPIQLADSHSSMSRSLSAAVGVPRTPSVIFP